jgi:hypothetical protein
VIGNDDQRRPSSVDFTVNHDHKIPVIEPLGSTADHEDWGTDDEGAHLDSDSLTSPYVPAWKVL